MKAKVEVDNLKTLCLVSVGGWWWGDTHPTLLLPGDGDPLELPLQQRLPLLGDMVHQVLALLLEEPMGTDGGR